MAVLLDAIGTMATPTPAAAVAADEFAAFMEAAVDPRPAPSRLSFQPRDVIQTPASATDSPPAADSAAAPDVALTPAASSLPRPGHTSMQAAIDGMALQAAMKEQAAELKYQALMMQMKEAAHVADMAHAAQASACAAQAAELKYQALLMQMKEAEHTADMARAAQASACVADAAAAAQLTRTATEPPGPVMVASVKQTKFIGLQLVPYSTESFITANSIRPGVTAEAISDIVLVLLNALSAVQGQQHYASMIGWLLNLSLRHDVSSAGGSTRLIVGNITAILAGEAGGTSETDDDSTSTGDSYSSASDSPSPPRYDIFDGKAAARKRKALHSLLGILGGVGDIVHTCMVHWAAIDRALLAILKLLVPKTAPIMFKGVQRQSSFVEGLQIVLFQIGHGVKSYLVDCFDVITRPISYANDAGTFDDVTIAAAMHTLIGDFEERIASYGIVKDHAPLFCMVQAMKSFPTASGGSLAGVIYDLERDLRKADVSSSPEALVNIILDAIQGIGTTELTGTMQVAVQKQRPNGGVSRATEPAASAMHVGGKGKGMNVAGKGKGGKGTATLQQGEKPYQRPKCLDGSQCKGYGTLEGCSKEHEAEDMAMMQEALGTEFISHAMRLRLLPILKKLVPQPTAATTVTPQQRAEQAALRLAALSGTQPTATATVTPQQAALRLQAQIRAAQLNHPQDGSVPSGAAVPSVPPFALSSVGRDPEKRPSGSIDASILPGYPPGQPPTTTINNFYITVPTGKSPHQAEHAASVQQSVSRPPTSGVIEDILQHLAPFCFGDFPAYTAVTMLDACGHHAIPSTDLSHTVPSLPSQSPCEQPVGAATSLMPAAYTESVNMPARTIGDPDTIIMPLISAAALTSTIRAIPMATGPKRPMRAHHRAGHGEWIGATEPTTMGVSRTVREQARIERAAQIAESNERMQPHFRYPYSLP